MWKIGEIRNESSNFKMKSLKTFSYYGILLYFWHCKKLRTHVVEGMRYERKGYEIDALVRHNCSFNF